MCWTATVPLFFLVYWWMFRPFPEMDLYIQLHCFIPPHLHFLCAFLVSAHFSLLPSWEFSPPSFLQRHWSKFYNILIDEYWHSILNWWILTFYSELRSVLELIASNDCLSHSQTVPHSIFSSEWGKKSTVYHKTLKTQKHLV